MLDEEIQDRCRQILDSLEAILLYFEGMKSADDFIRTKEGRLRLDAITMRLQVVGENVKRVEGQHSDFFKETFGLDTKDIIRFRDFISHHYERLDYEIIYDTCLNRIPFLKEIFKHYLDANGNA